MRRVFRVWMTRCLAVVGVSFAAGGWAQPGWVRTSPYDFAETVERIEQQVQRRGLHVFALIGPQVQQRPASGRDELVIVLEPAQNGTPVLMVSDGGTPEVPLSLHVRRNAANQVEVAGRAPQDGELPDELARLLDALPALVDSALGVG